MRKWFLVFFVLFSGLIFAQNYNPINPTREAWFEINYWSPRIIPVQIDSVRISGSDTSYFNSKIFRTYNLSSFCIPTKDTNIFMDKMIALSNGDHFLFNGNNDTILLKPFSTVNNSWKLYNYSNGDYIEATVGSIIQQVIFGNPDSVKIISLQAKNSANLPITNIFNGKEIRIAKNNGITHFYNTKDFPSDTISIDLIGKSNPEEGITNLTAAKIYDWNVGDEFHYQGGWNAMANGSMNEYEQFIVLTKTISTNLDTIVYTKDHIYYSKQYQWTPTFDSTIYYLHDTVSQVVIISAPDILNNYSYEFIDSLMNFGSGYLYQYNDNQYEYPFIGKIKKTVDPNFYLNPTDSCVSDLVVTCPHYYTYAEGIGFVSDKSIPNMGCSEKSLVYFHKGTEIWGTPLDWLAITNVNSSSQLISGFSSFPNPTNSISEISFNLFSPTDVEISIYDSQGKLVQRKFCINLNSGNHIIPIDLSTDSDGIYFCKLRTSSGEEVNAIIAKVSRN